MNAQIARVIATLQTSGIAPMGSTRGCALPVIASIEQEIGASLPAAYRDFLAHLGLHAGAFLQGSDFECGELGRLNAEARELAEAEGLAIPGAAFVFLMHQGYQFLYFLLGDGDDPEVYRFEEGAGIQPLRMSFATWLSHAADDEIRIAQGLRG